MDRALAMYRDMGSRHWEGVILHSLAQLHHAEGRIVEARQYAEAALAVGRETANRDLLGMARGTLGQLLFEQGQVDEARDALLAGEAVL